VIREGTVTAFDSKRGLGEIEGADGRAYPFHCTKIADGTREISGDPPPFLARRP
jgi:hypothetical protein